jgi:hypothetical protein
MKLPKNKANNEIKTALAKCYKLALLNESAQFFFELG